jgi:hypothetical protein
LIDSIEKIESELFNGFFMIKEVRQRLESDYHQFVKKQSEALLSGYQYVQSSYTIDGHAPSEPNLVKDLLKYMASSKPTLILVEAAAGFGKTCTAYELIFRLVSSTAGPINTPLFTELSRNREARVFRHVLLDEIARFYRGLNPDLVEHEIMKGRIPLVIDGFDELLFRGVSKKTDEVLFQETAPMLETISELLDGSSANVEVVGGNAKVVLTTRRTAVLAGESFSQWVKEKGEKFDIVRFSILEPTVDDWLGHERKAKLVQKGLPLEKIRNPVLLSYLRNIDDEKFERHCSSPSGILDHYFESMFQREMGRQDLC